MEKSAISVKEYGQNWRLRWGGYFLLAAISFNCLHYLLFRDTDYIFKFIFAQLGFLPISVFLVTVVINSLLARREKQTLLNKMNMVIGTFFSETGNPLLGLFKELDRNIASIRPQLLVSQEWRQRFYLGAQRKVGRHDFRLEPLPEQLDRLRTFLLDKRNFLLGLLRNPTLLEHDSFSDLLWSVFHLTEELGFRDSFSADHSKDIEHLAGDIQRAYVKLLQEWLSYMQHLQQEYPYLFSLAVRTNPFSEEARVEIR